MATQYQIGKKKAQAQAVSFSNTFANTNLSWADIARYEKRFQRLGKRYGLLREFRENGLC